MMRLGGLFVQLNTLAVVRTLYAPKLGMSSVGPSGRGGRSMTPQSESV